MITIKLSFFAILQTKFGHEQHITVKAPIRLIQLLDLFHSKSGEKASSFFLENKKLKSGFTILIDGRNIHALEGVNTVLENKCELSFFPLLAGGFINTK
ncbi:MAG: MoaD/ThiS family protein [Candidatus Hodarchaeales archaeon]|jgi:molybdopterin converting factor small subunit